MTKEIINMPDHIEVKELEKQTDMIMRINVGRIPFCEVFCNAIIGSSKKLDNGKIQRIIGYKIEKDNIEFYFEITKQGAKNDKRMFRL